MDAQDPTWAPQRPVRVDRRGATIPPESPPAAPAGIEWRFVGATRRRRPAVLRRVVLAYAALAAVIAVVLGVGLHSQPVYGAMTPYGGVPVDDLRTAASAPGWTLDLAAQFHAGVPTKCLVYHSGTISAHRTLVTATLPEPSSFGANPQCENADGGTVSRLVMVDPTTGRVVWERDLAHDAGEMFTSLVWQHSAAAGIVVGVTNETTARLVELSSATGRIVSDTSVFDPDEAINFGVVGPLVLSVAPDSAGAVDTYTLRRAGDLATTLWTSALSSAMLPQLLSDRVIVPDVDGTDQVDGRTGDVTPWATDLKAYRAVQVRSDRIVALSNGPTGSATTNVVLLDAAGQVVWSRSIDAVTALTFSRSCVVVSSGVDTITCLARDTGATKWAVTRPGSVVGTPTGSTTDDIETIAPIGSGDDALTIVEMSGDSGRARFTASIPRGSEIEAQSTATGYAIDRTTADGVPSIAAFDLADGRALWSRSSPQIDVWGGRVVLIDSDGRAHEVVANRRASPHDMLVG